MASHTSSDVFEELGVRKIINARGNETLLGGSSVSQEVREAMEGANFHYVEMRELLEKSGEHIADMLGVEAAYITSGCAAALTLSTAACMVGTDLEKMGRLPDTSGMKNEILIQKKHRYSYDRCFTTSGGKLVEVGDEDGCTAEQLSEAFGPNTAAVAYFAQPNWDSTVLPLTDVAGIARERSVPVIVDAASQIYPLDYFRRTAQAGDLVCFGAKYFGAPHSTGFVCGKRELVDAVAAQSFIGYETSGRRAIGRPMKVDRQEVVGVVSAFRTWLTTNHEDRLEQVDIRIAAIRESLRGVPNIRTEVDDRLAPWGPDLDVVLDTAALGRSAEQVVQQLADGTPSIRVRVASDDTIIIRVHTLNEGEVEVVSDELRKVLAG